MPSLLTAVLTLLLLTPVTLAAGRELAPRPTGISAYAQQMPLVAASRGKFVTVWLESLDRAGWRYLGAFTDAEGNRITPTPFVVVPDGSAGSAQLIGGDVFTLFLPHDDGVQLMQLDFEGRGIATHIVPLRNFRYDPSVARVASQFAAVEHGDFLEPYVRRGDSIYVVEEYASDDMLFDPVYVIPATAPLRVWVRSRATRVTAVGPGGASRLPVRRRSARP